MTISQATRSNWARLQADPAEKLRRGANKSRSPKRFCPAQYATNLAAALWAAETAAFILKHEIGFRSAISSVGLQLLEKQSDPGRRCLQKMLTKLRAAADDRLTGLPLPESGGDLLGLLYQTLLTEGEKNRRGAYYTAPAVAAEMAKRHHPGPGGAILDPCCGSGAILLALNAASPESLWGMDNDPLAVLICRINLFCRYPGTEFEPHVYCGDFLQKRSPDPGAAKLFARRFDAVITNPPWGSKPDGAGREKTDSFTRFFECSMQQLVPGGALTFLFPETVLQTRRHRDLRAAWLEKYCLEEIVLRQEAFSGVMSKAVTVTILNALPAERFVLRNGERSTQVTAAEICRDPQRVITILAPADRVLLAKIDGQKKYDLSRSRFALGIVTGDNRRLLTEEPDGKNSEAVITGKEVGRYTLGPPCRYLTFDRSKFQQCAPEALYRAPEKLVYRFISRDLLFSYDDTGKLLLNSANLLVPAVPGTSPKSVLALLNSDVLRYYYRMRFRTLKVLKSNLLALPFLELSPAEDAAVAALTEKLLQGDETAEQPLQQLICQLYKLSPREIGHIRKSLRDGGKSA